MAAPVFLLEPPVLADEPLTWLPLPFLKMIWYPPARISNGRLTFFM